MAGREVQGGHRGPGNPDEVVFAFLSSFLVGGLKELQLDYIHKNTITYLRQGITP
jgi:hypothetical protein